jgi:hypothetical protein
MSKIPAAFRGRARYSQIPAPAIAQDFTPAPASVFFDELLRTMSAPETNCHPERGEGSQSSVLELPRRVRLRAHRNAPTPKRKKRGAWQPPVFAFSVSRRSAEGIYGGAHRKSGV